MKNPRSILLLWNVAAVTSGFCLVPSWAQTTEDKIPAVELSEAIKATQWEKLQRVNSAAQSIHVVWHCVRRIKARPARPEKDVELQAQSMMKSARERGLDEEKVAQLGDVVRKTALDSQKERVIETTFDFVRIGNSVLCNAVYPAPELSGRFIEFSDGINSIHAINEFRGEIRAPSGFVTRDPEGILYMSAVGPQVARLMLAIPFDQEFGPDNPILWRKDAKLRQSADGDWLVERQFRESGQTKFLAPNTLTFGGDGAYLSSFEELITRSVRVSGEGKNQKIEKIDYEPGHKIVGSEFKQYAGGIWFPSRIARTSPNESYEYTLIEVQFNDDVDPFGLTLPPDLRVTDARLITDANYQPDRRTVVNPKIVVYTTKAGRLMTDDEVKAKKFLR